MFASVDSAKFGIDDRNKFYPSLNLSWLFRKDLCFLTLTILHNTFFWHISINFLFVFFSDGWVIFRPRFVANSRRTLVGFSGMFIRMTQTAHSPGESFCSFEEFTLIGVSSSNLLASNFVSNVS